MAHTGRGRGRGGSPTRFLAAMSRPEWADLLGLEPEPEEGVPELLLLGDPRLLQIALGPPRSTREGRGTHSRLEKHISALLRSLDEYGGLGLSAPQIGWDARVFVLGDPSLAAEPIDPSLADGYRPDDPSRPIPYQVCVRLA